MFQEDIASLCAKYTNLSTADQQIISDYAVHLQVFADLCNADVFIDCMDRSSRTVVVVAHAWPSRGESLYQEVAVGKTVIPKNEPGVFATFRDARPSIDIRAVTQENITVQQNIVPLLNKSGHIIGILIREKDISDKLARSRKYETMLHTNLRLQNNLDNLRVEQDVDVYSNHYLTVQLSEMSHRIKNNLQMLASIMNMEARRSHNEQAEALLSKNAGRVLTIATLHDTLCSLGSESELALKPLLARVIDSVLTYLPQCGCQVEFEVVGSDIVVNPDLAGALMLIVNELVTNSVKHAFVGRVRGRVEVRLAEFGSCRSLTVSDDGRGLSEDANRQSSLGLTIVKMTVKERIKGNLSISSGLAYNEIVNQGVVVRVDF